MANYYFDLQTTGLDPARDKIITIQFQALDRRSGRPTGELIILKEWESSEKNILQQAISQLQMNDPYPFAFIPSGYNPLFEQRFLRARMHLHGLLAIDLFERPFVDLRALGILMNKGEFKGSGLELLLGESTDGKLVPEWYARKEFDALEKYLRTKADTFVEFYHFLSAHAPLFLEQFRIARAMRPKQNEKKAP